MSQNTLELALDGGTPLNTEPWPSFMLGPEAIGEEEIAAVTAVFFLTRMDTGLCPIMNQTKKSLLQGMLFQEE